MAKRVYIETTVPSAYVSTRADHGSQHRREVSRQWWREQLTLYEASISDAVVLELAEGDWAGKAEALQLVESLPRLAVDDESIAIAARYIAERVMPAELGGDATHLAVACLHDVDFLLTWNIRHLANPNKLEHLTVINRRLGLFMPQIVTPEALWLEADA